MIVMFYLDYVVIVKGFNVFYMIVLKLVGWIFLVN